MSATRWSSGRLKRQSFASDVIVTVLQPTRRDDVYPEAEQRFEFLGEMERVEQRTAVFEVDEKVDPPDP